MKYCTKCGANLEEGQQSCPSCGYCLDFGENEVPVVNNTTVEPKVSLTKAMQEVPVEEDAALDTPAVQTQPAQTIARGAGDYSSEAIPRRSQYTGAEEPALSNAQKVLMTALTLLLPGIGTIFGLIAGLVYMNKPYTDHRSFGKALLCMSLILFGMQLLCCCAGMFLSSAGYY